MKIRIFKIPYRYSVWKSGIFAITYEGYIESDTFDENVCWDLCNWCCYRDNKPDNLFSNVEIANSDIFFFNPESNKYYIALAHGWEVKDSLKEVAIFYLTDFKSVFSNILGKQPVNKGEI